MSKRLVHVPRADEEPEMEDLRYPYEEATVDYISEMSESAERLSIGGYYDERKVRWVA